MISICTGYAAKANTILHNIGTTKDSMHSGIYLNWKDYRNKKLTFEINCLTSKHKINTHEFLSKPYIDVTHQGIKHRFKKDFIFGYRDCDGKDFRFFDNKECRILENDSITIYVIQVPKTKGKGFKLVPEYYFSSKIGDVILPLNILNLKNAYPVNHKFHDMLDIQSDLSEYDSFHKMYKINHLLRMSYQ